jgi:hypothetical protein
VEISDSQEERVRVLSLSNLVAINSESREYLLSIFLTNLTMRWQQYEDDILNDLWLEYTILPEGTNVIPRKKVINYTGKLIIDNKTSRIDLPVTMDISKWTNNYIADTKTMKVFKLGDNIITIRINKVKGLHVHTIDIKNFDGDFIHQIIDTKLKSIKSTLSLIGQGSDSRFEHFQRQFRGQVSEFINGEEILFEKNIAIENKGRYITKILKDKKYIFNILTLDLETRTIEGLLTPISIAWYNGLVSNCLHILDHVSVDDMMNEAIDKLFIPENHGKSVYIHNFSNFDSIFLLKYLASKVSDIHSIKDFFLIKREDNIIILKVKINNVLLIFKDSYLLLPNSLKKLAEGFGVTLKSEFNHEVNNSDEGLLSNKDKLIEYNINDCIVLYEVLQAFSNEIFKMFKLNITRFATLPSLAFGNFRCNFMKKVNIPKTTHSQYIDIVSGYSGGHVEVYKPISEPGKKVFGYDVNSLYPSEMAKNLFPVGNAKYFEVGVKGRFNLNDPLNFGIFFAHIDAPKSLSNNPLLLTKIKGRTIAPIGTWSGWYFSEELKYAVTLPKGGGI